MPRQKQLSKQNFLGIQEFKNLLDKFKGTKPKYFINEILEFARWS